MFYSNSNKAWAVTLCLSNGRDESFIANVYTDLSPSVFKSIVVHKINVSMCFFELTGRPRRAEITNTSSQHSFFLFFSVTQPAMHSDAERWNTHAVGLRAEPGAVGPAARHAGLHLT